MIINKDLIDQSRKGNQIVQVDSKQVYEFIYLLITGHGQEQSLKGIANEGYKQLIRIKLLIKVVEFYDREDLNFAIAIFIFQQVACLNFFYYCKKMDQVPSTERTAIKNDNQLQRKNLIGTPDASTDILKYAKILLFLASIASILLLLFAAHRIQLQAKLERNSSQVTALFLVVNEDSDAEQSINSFTRHYSFLRIIVASHKKINLKLDKSVVNKIQWFLTVRPFFDVYFLDDLIRTVQTKYYFFSTTQWKCQDPLFVQSALLDFKKQEDIAQRAQPSNSSMMPKVHKRSDYDLLGSQGFSGQINGKERLEKGMDKIPVFYKRDNKDNGDRSKSVIIQDSIKDVRPENTDQKQKLKSISPIVLLGQMKDRQEKKVIQNLRPGYPPLFQIHLWKAQLNIREPEQIYEIEKLKEQKNLPFCLIIKPSIKYSQEELQKSVKEQKYWNYKSFILEKQVGYFETKKQIQEKCQKNGPVLFVNSPLKSQALSYMNRILQFYRTWILFNRSQGFLQIFAFYPRIYHLLESNDFEQKNKWTLQQNNLEAQTLGMLELCLESAIEIEKQRIFDILDPAYLIIQKKTFTNTQRSPYQKILRLSQDFQIQLNRFEQARNQFKKKQVHPVYKLTPVEMYRAVDRQEEWYLPQNHTIQQLQYQYYSQKYKINNYQSIDKQVRFCITVLSHNNIQNDRYIKVMRSIVQQKYENYHIVFIDDFSTDNNMNGTIEYLKSIKFPMDRVTFVQNLQRNFATYNIMNAAFNFCGADDVQMLMDGDDEFVGKYAFQVMNSFYQDPQTWVAYSNYKTNYFTFGRSRPMNSETEHAVNGRRSFISVFGAIRSWRVKVVYKIPLQHHKLANKQWLDTVYDDALGHPLVQISTVKRFKYVPEILYQYNIRYGDNDDSTPQKIRHRSDAYRHVISHPTLPSLSSLESVSKDQEVLRDLASGLGIRYKTIAT